VPTQVDLITELFSGIGRFRRQIRRRAPRSFDGVTESQAEFLRLIGRRPGISVSAAAAELGLAANTASTLVSRLSASGALLRSPDPEDRRVTRLHLAPSAQELADASRAARRSALADVLDELDDRETASLAAGLDVLAKITRLLEEHHP